MKINNIIVQKLKPLKKTLVLAVAASPIIYATIQSFNIDLRNNFNQPASVVAAQSIPSAPSSPIQSELSSNSKNQSVQFLSGAYPILLGLLGMVLVSSCQTVLFMVVSRWEQSGELKKIDKHTERMRIELEFMERRAALELEEYRLRK